jgi:hypothetical protein
LKSSSEGIRINCTLRNPDPIAIHSYTCTVKLPPELAHYLSPRPEPVTEKSLLQKFGETPVKMDLVYTTNFDKLLEESTASHPDRVSTNLQWLLLHGGQERVFHGQPEFKRVVSQAAVMVIWALLKNMLDRDRHVISSVDQYWEERERTRIPTVGGPPPA